MTTPGSRTPRRRRGAELESALLDAAWGELVETGFARMTMESVAARAHTGIAVLYRRWANKDELVLAALEHHQRTHPIDIPDTGTLRGDLLAILTAMGVARAGFWAVAAPAAFSALVAGTGQTPAQARARILGAERPARVEALYRRAHQRGEIDIDAVPPAVLAMPFDLVRHDMFMDMKSPKPERIRSIVDDLFLPLIRQHSGASDPGDSATPR